MSSSVVFFPVRHHSPAAALALRATARKLRPAAILVEGPSDFNDRIGELFLPHALPIAIYSYYRTAEGERRGAYYPFCEYSPEWQAAEAAKELGAAFRFIDLPWADLDAAGGNEERTNQRYADDELRRSAYVAALCRELSVDGFDDLWDELFEIDGELSPEAYIERAGLFCLHSRELGGAGPDDLARETFMAERIADARKAFRGSLLVVTGGFHTPALRAALEGKGSRPPIAAAGFNSTDAKPSAGEGAGVKPLIPAEDRGIALTPYSDARLDSLKGYEAGMPGPGFYREVWNRRAAGEGFDHRRIIGAVAASLRAKKQQFSAADLIASGTASRALADLRGHREVWRRDIVDGLRGALVKDDLARGGSHPLLDAIAEVFRGNRIGRLAAGVTLPPLVADLRAAIERLDLAPADRERTVELELHREGDRERSRVLHRLRILEIKGFSFAEGTDLVVRGDLSEVRESWELRWTPEMDASAVEASRYGPNLEEAAAAALAERASSMGRDAEKAAALLLDAALAGVGARLGSLIGTLEALIRSGGDFLSAARALDHLMFLYAYDTILEFAGKRGLGPLIAEAWRRSLYLFEGLGVLTGKDRELTEAVRALASAFERCGPELGLRLEELAGTLRRVREDCLQSPLARGAALGALWTAGEADRDEAVRALRAFHDPAMLGDFLTGLFALAREEVRRDQAILDAVDARLTDFTAGEFQEALPALRLAFTYFTPREKGRIAERIAGGGDSGAASGAAPMEGLAVGAEEAAATLVFEERLFDLARLYGIGGVNR